MRGKRINHPKTQSCTELGLGKIPAKLPLIITDDQDLRQIVIETLSHIPPALYSATNEINFTSTPILPNAVGTNDSSLGLVTLTRSALLKKQDTCHYWLSHELAHNFASFNSWYEESARQRADKIRDAWQRAVDDDQKSCAIKIQSSQRLCADLSPDRLRRRTNGRFRLLANQLGLLTAYSELRWQTAIQDQKQGIPSSSCDALDDDFAEATALYIHSKIHRGITLYSGDERSLVRLSRFSVYPTQESDCLGKRFFEELWPHRFHILDGLFS